MIVQGLLASYAIAKTYATWNPSDKNANITLSSGNLTATASTVNHFACRATI
jgi:hypothetical protein